MDDKKKKIGKKNKLDKGDKRDKEDKGYKKTKLKIHNNVELHNVLVLDETKQSNKTDITSQEYSSMEFNKDPLLLNLKNNYLFYLSLLVGIYFICKKDNSSFVFGILNLKRYRDKEREAVEKAKYWLDIIGLTNRADDNAGDLPYGDQRKLEIVRAMCINPKLLCLDEPAAGLNPKESSELNKLLEFIKKEKKTGILLIEHDMSVVMGISDHVVVLNYGKKIFQGTPAETRRSKAVIEAYLGVDE